MLVLGQKLVKLIALFADRRRHLLVGESRGHRVAIERLTLHVVFEFNLCLVLESKFHHIDEANGDALAVERFEVLAERVEDGCPVRLVAADRILVICIKVLQIQHDQIGQECADALECFRILDHVALQIEPLKPIARLDGVDRRKLVVTEVANSHLGERIDARQHRDAVVAQVQLLEIEAFAEAADATLDILVRQVEHDYRAKVKFLGDRLKVERCELRLRLRVH